MGRVLFNPYTSSCEGSNKGLKSYSFGNPTSTFPFRKVKSPKERRHKTNDFDSSCCFYLAALLQGIGTVHTLKPTPFDPGFEFIAQRLYI